GRPDDGRTLGEQAVDTVPEAQLDEPLLDALAHAAHERPEHAGARAPGDVEAGNRVAVAGGGVAAPLGPADDREERDALLAQPGALLARREGEVGLGPLARPIVLRAVELGAAHPVLAGQFVRVADAHPALLGR